MTTTRALVDEGVQRLRSLGFDTPRLDSELLLAHAIGVGRTAVVAHGDAPVGADAEARPMDLSLVDSSGAPKVTWRIKEAIPIRLTGPALNASSNEVAIDSLDVMAAGVSVVQGG